VAFRHEDPWGDYLVGDESELVLWAPSALHRFRHMLAAGSILRILGAILGGGSLALIGFMLADTASLSTNDPMASVQTIGASIVLGGLGIVLGGTGAALQSWARAALPSGKPR